MIPNNIYTPEKYVVTNSHTFYKQLKSIIWQDYLISKEIFEKNQKPFNSIKLLSAYISKNTVCFNPNLININNTDNYEIERQVQIGVGKVNHNIIEDLIIVSAIPEYEQLCMLAEKQFIDWWENEVSHIIELKYKGMNNANSICQFARQLRNAFGHSKVNIKENLKSVDPVWCYLNLKQFNGQKVFDLISLADLVNFWIEFEDKELK